MILTLVEMNAFCFLLVAEICVCVCARAYACEGQEH